MQHTLSTTIHKNLDIKKILKIQRGTYVSFIVYVDINNKTKCSVYSRNTQKFYVLDYPTKRAESSIITEQNDGTIFLIFANTQDNKVIVNFYKITRDSDSIKILPFQREELTEYPESIKVQKSEYTDPILVELSNKNRIGIIAHASYDPDILQFQMSNSVIMWTMIIHPNGNLSLLIDDPTSNKMYSSLFGNMQKFSNISPDNLKLDVRISLNPNDYQLTVLLAQSLKKDERQYTNNLNLFDTTIVSTNDHCHIENVACQLPTPNLIKNKDSDHYIKDVMIIGLENNATLAYIEDSSITNKLTLKILKEGGRNKRSQTLSKRKEFNFSTLLTNQTKIEFVKIEQNGIRPLIILTENRLIEYKLDTLQNKLPKDYTINNNYIMRTFFEKNNAVISNTEFLSTTQFPTRQSTKSSTDDYEKESKKPLSTVATTLLPYKANTSYDPHQPFLLYAQNYTHNTTHFISQRTSNSQNMPPPQSLGTLSITMLTLGIFSLIFLASIIIIKIIRGLKASKNPDSETHELKITTLHYNNFFHIAEEEEETAESSNALLYSSRNTTHYSRT